MRTLIKRPHYIYLYFFCQSINLITAVISVTIAASVGTKISSDPLYATVPYGMQFLLLLMGTYPASLLMSKYGRKFGFYLGAAFLSFAGVTGYFAVIENSFVLLIAAHGLIGLFTACANFYRYAVTDGLDKTFQSPALSLVVAGGVIAGILGPTISSQLRDVPNFAPFSLCYAFLIILSVINCAIIYFLPDFSPKYEPKQIKTAIKTTLGKRNFAYISICVAAFGYGLMNLLMIQSSLKMDNMHVAFENAALAIQWHVVAMFFPSFFTGFLIARFGHILIAASGFILLAISFLINIYNASYDGIIFSLILLGLGWNFTYVGGSSMLALSLLDNPEKQKWQGIGDTIIAIFATIGAMAPSFLFNKIGWESSNIISISICLIPFFAIILLKIKNKSIY